MQQYPGIMRTTSKKVNYNPDDVFLSHGCVLAFDHIDGRLVGTSNIFDQQQFGSGMLVQLLYVHQENARPNTTGTAGYLHGQ